MQGFSTFFSELLGIQKLHIEKPCSKQCVYYEATLVLKISVACPLRTVHEPPVDHGPPVGDGHRLYTSDLGEQQRHCSDTAPTKER
ncbi:hypothetical protein E2C01_062521 [Portunus trituberculatus]|uniref:Uncharacterized protein n=1 Tax=Portunus trituberculatus TaxID=210409 RepID=A0A5B7H6M0_PORTR|nr:hypothetical protein [Portunus trituberculatus]